MTAVPPVVWVVAADETARRWVGQLREEGFAAGALPWATARSLAFDPAALEGHDLVLFTSGRAARVLPEGAGEGLLAACVGAATAQAARSRGFEVVLVGEAGGADVARRILADWPEARRVLFLCGADARHEAPEVLTAGGVVVETVPVYAMEPAADFAPGVARAPAPAAVVLGSPRACDALAALGRPLPAEAVLVALGAVTAERAAARFARPAALAPQRNGAGLAAALRAALQA